MLKNILLFLISLAYTSCGESVLPKPKGEIRLEYPDAKYDLYSSKEMHCHFEKSKYADVHHNGDNWISLKYPNMKATLHLTHKNIDHNVNVFIDDVMKLMDEHTVKANGIIPNPYSNEEVGNYGTLYQLTGNVASNIQFYITDSTKNILYGALYFYTVPNADSLSPAVEYIKKDIFTLMETIRWDDDATNKDIF